LIEVSAGGEDVDQLLKTMALTLPATYDASRMHAPALALVAVHIAANANSTEEGFRPLFYDRLHFSGDWTSLWQNIHGPAIRQFLEVNFPEVELPEIGKPFAYVGSIYRHCGVPPAARGELATVICSLILRHQWHFNSADLRGAAIGVDSTILRDFFDSNTGFEFCRSICLGAAHLLSGDLQPADLPEYRRGLVVGLVDLLGQRRETPKYVPEPVLRLDPERGTVEVCFDIRGIRDAAYHDESGVVISQARLALEDCPEMVLIGHGSKPIRWRWSRLWDRKSGEPARFRSGSRGFIPRLGPVGSSSHYILVPSAIAPASDWVYVSQLRFRDDPLIWHVYKADKQHVESRPSNPPTLGWKRSKVDPDLPGNIFLAPLPRMTVKNWTPESASVYRVVLEDGKGCRTLQVVDGSAVFPDGIEPGQCEIRLERTVISNDQCVDRAPFVLLPSPGHISFVEALVGGTQVVHLHCLSPRDWELHFNPVPREIRSGLYEFAGPLWTVRVEYRKGASSFRVDLPCPRVLLKGVSHREDSPDNDVVWIDDVNDLRCLTAGFKVPRLEVTLQTGHDVRVIGSVQTDVGGTTCGVSINNEALASALQCSPLLQAGVKAGDRHVACGVFIGSPEYVEQSICRGAFDFREAAVPPSFRSWVQAMRAIIETPQDGLSAVAFPRHKRLHELTADILLGAATFDATVVPLPLSSLLESATWAIREVLNWRIKGLQLVSDKGQDCATLLSEFDSLRLGALAASRWIESLLALRDSVVNAPAVLRKDLQSWRDAIDHDPTGSPMTPFSSLQGGQDLVRAAQCYRRAGRARGSQRTSNLLAALGHVEQALIGAEAGGLVNAIGRTLKVMILRRSGNISAIPTVLTSGEFPLPMRDLQVALSTFAQPLPNNESTATGESIRLDDIFTPWPDDRTPNDNG
jgi:hypothetical protein